MDTGPSEVETPSAPILGPKRAFFVFLVFFAVHLAVGVVIGFFGALWYVFSYGSGPRVVADLQRAVVMPAALAGEIVGGIAAFRMTRRSLPGRIGSGALLPIGWSRASSRGLLLASSGGVALASLYVFGLVPAFPPSPGQQWGPMATTVQSGGWPRHAWALLALVVAPPIEEFVFRGVVFTGLRRSWKPGSAGALVVFLFLAMHFPDITSYGPAALGVVAVGGATLVARTATKSLVPAIVLHASYNLVLVVVTYASAS